MNRIYETTHFCQGLRRGWGGGGFCPDKGYPNVGSYDHEEIMKSPK
jgi:hypothetical protein